MRRWLYLIAEFSYGGDRIEEALRAGVDYIQLREKNISSAEYLKRARYLRKITEKYNTKLIINDRLDIAFLSRADGVHLGQSDVPVEDARKFLGRDKIIGATAKTSAQAVQAQKEGADYLGSGAWYPTVTKEDAVPISEDTYREILKAVTIPNVAVGGLTGDNCKRALNCGAHGLAISAGILKAEDVSTEVKRIRKILEEA